MNSSSLSFSSSASTFANQLIEMYTSSFGSWSYIIIGLATFTTMFSTTMTSLDASPRAMHKATELIFNKKINNGNLYWLFFLVQVRGIYRLPQIGYRLTSQQLEAQRETYLRRQNTSGLICSFQLWAPRYCFLVIIICCGGVSLGCKPRAAMAAVILLSILVCVTRFRTSRYSLFNSFT